MTPTTSAEIRRLLCRRGAALGVPVSGIFELTPRCNLRCKMCYVRLTPEQMAPLGQELTAAQWLALAQEARAAGMVFLLITGGEPMLRPDFEEIYEALATMGFSIAINTNGTLLTPRLRELFHRLPPAQMNVTLYGTCPEDYEALCGDGSAFHRVEETLHWLQSEQMLVHLNCTVTPDNVHHFHRMEDYAKSLGLDLRLTAYCLPPSRREGCDACNGFRRLPAEKAAELLVKDILIREGLPGIQARAKNLSTPPQADCDLGVGDTISCMAGRSQFWVSWNGVMSPCGMFTQPGTWPVEQGFGAAWEQLKEQTAAIRLCPECKACAERETCMNCAAVTFTETGSFSGKPEYMCRLNRSYRETLTALAQAATGEHHE